ncbi:hypothetical protein LCGC14_1230590 [marine sediment metagenome]|uniref:Uncharacterized protein n=1 Tax=marine sediment metagenome TaxID=412755 RepID=A0A0F9L8M5_9ZZZZ
MADNLLSGAQGMVSQGIQDALGLVKEQLGDQRSKQRVRLTNREQVDLFLRMTPNDFTELRSRVGEEQFQRYWKRMRNLGEANV